MAPLLLGGFGIAFVVLVVRTSGIDIVPDSIGLALYAVALWRLARGSALFVVAAALAGIGAVVALLNFAPHQLAASVATGVAFAYNVLVLLAIAVGAEALCRRAQSAGDTIGRQFRIIAGLAALGLVLLIAAWVVSASDHERALSVLSIGQLLSVATMIWYVVALVRSAPRGWAQVEATRRLETSAPVRDGDPHDRPQGLPDVRN